MMDLIYPDYDATMNFRYGNKARPGVKSRTTFDAVVAGERTATTRRVSVVDAWQAGEIVRFWSGTRVFEGKSVLVRVVSTRLVNLTKMDDAQLDEWSRLEGWSVKAAKEFSYWLLSGDREQVIFEKLERQNP